MNRSVVRAGILMLALVTAVLHVIAGIAPLRPPLIVNAAGYVALAAALLLNLPFLAGREKLVRYAFIGYTVVTILAWIPAGDRTMLGYADKAVEVVLAALLVVYHRSAARA